MSYDKAKTFDRADEEMDKKIKEKEREQDITSRNWDSLFTEPIETLYIIMNDLITFKVSSQDERQVFLTLGTLEKKLRTKERDYKMGDIAVIIHNHLNDRKFSPIDKKQHRRFKKYGFKGYFLLYSHTANKTIEYKPDEKKTIIKKEDK